MSCKHSRRKERNVSALVIRVQDVCGPRKISACVPRSSLFSRKYFPEMRLRTLLSRRIYADDFFLLFLRGCNAEVYNRVSTFRFFFVFFFQEVGEVLGEINHESKLAPCSLKSSEVRGSPGLLSEPIVRQVLVHYCKVVRAIQSPLEEKRI